MILLTHSADITEMSELVWFKAYAMTMNYRTYDEEGYDSVDLSGFDHAIVYGDVGQVLWEYGVSPE